MGLNKLNDQGYQASKGKDLKNRYAETTYCFEKIKELRLTMSVGIRSFGEKEVRVPNCLLRDLHGSLKKLAEFLVCTFFHFLEPA